MVKNILVTGAGALLGQGILRLLNVSDFSKKIYTADPDPRSTGHWLGDCALTIPKATDANYIDEIVKIVIEYKIDALLVGTDVELNKFAEVKNQFLDKYNCVVVVSSQEVINIANDKFLTAKFLEENNFPFPKSVMATNMDNLMKLKDEVGFPLFAKPIDGARSMGLVKINNQEELLAIYDEKSNLVVQQYLSDEMGEFTSGCVVVKGKCKAIITLKRDLRDGNTYRAYRDAESDIYNGFIKEIAEKLNPDGPVNFQFRILDGKPIIFEINGRFSGTTPLRSFFGFNELEALLKFYLFNQEIEEPELKNGMVFRTWSDIFVAESEFDNLKNNHKLENPKAKFYNFNLTK
ncbi:ATP-grasp domain-containing protein [Flavobacterium sp. LB1P62]|uniref:ATP-grasp domain-containing protein n=1 Tax=Flavobacterium sp. LB1P62 TaxID=3401715 RepID=UPI003AAFA433